MKILDTDFLVNLLLGDEGAVAKAAEMDRGFEAATTIINVYEFYQVLRSAKIGEETKKGMMMQAKALFNRMEVLPLDIDAANFASTLALFKNKEGVNMSDIYIMAIAFSKTVFDVVTRNGKPFEILGRINVEKY